VYKATVGANSADVASVFSLTTGNPNIGATVTTSGPFSWLANEGDLPMTIEGSSVAATVQQIFDHNITYSKVSSPDIPQKEFANLPGLTGWTETIWTTQSQQRVLDMFNQGFFGLLGASSGQLSPASILGLLRAEASSVTNLGTQVLDGVTTTHYRAQIPLARLGDGSAAELQQVERLLGVDALSVDYWIGSSELLRQLQFAMTVPRQPDIPTTTVPGEFSVNFTYPITMSARLRLSDYGVPVHVVPPPADQITSIRHCIATADSVDCE
jgi:hypothetical protein